MRPQSDNQLEPDPRVLAPTTLYGEPWWRGVGYNTIPPVITSAKTSNSATFDGANGSESNDDQSMSNDRVNEEEEEDAKKESQTTASSRGGI